MLFEEYHAAKPGSLIRQRILETILRCLGKVNDKRGPSVGDLGLLNEEDLDRILKTHIDASTTEQKEERAADNPGSACGDAGLDDKAGSLPA
jgi:hypothetical protein